MLSTFRQRDRVSTASWPIFPLEPAPRHREAEVVPTLGAGAIFFYQHQNNQRRQRRSRKQHQYRQQHIAAKAEKNNRVTTRRRRQLSSPRLGLALRLTSHRFEPAKSLPGPVFVAHPQADRPAPVAARAAYNGEVFDLREKMACTVVSMVCSMVKPTNRRWLAFKGPYCVSGGDVSRKKTKQ